MISDFVEIVPEDDWKLGRWFYLDDIWTLGRFSNLDIKL